MRILDTTNFFKIAVSHENDFQNKLLEKELSLQYILKKGDRLFHPNSEAYKIMNKLRNTKDEEGNTIKGTPLTSMVVDCLNNGSLKLFLLILIKLNKIAKGQNQEIVGAIEHVKVIQEELKDSSQKVAR